MFLMLLPCVMSLSETTLFAQLRKSYKRMYRNCAKMIKDMTPEELPKKQKSKITMRASVNIPAGKSIGDELTFA